jgi:AraC-like DNA-binding protein
MRALKLKLQKSMMLNTGRWYKEHLGILLLVSIIPVTMLSVCMYWLGSQQIGKVIVQTNGKMFSQLSAQLISNVNQIELAARHWSYNPVFGESLNDMDIRDIQKTNVIIDVLSTMERSNALIEKAELFVNSKSVLISRFDGVSVIVNDSKRDSYHSLFAQPGDLFWHYGLDPRSSKGIESAALVQKVPAESSKPSGALIIHLNSDALNASIKQLTPSEEGFSLIINEKGERIASVGAHDSAPKKAELFAEKIASSLTEPSGSFNETLDLETYNISYASFPRNGWKFIGFTPISKLMEPIANVSRSIVILTLAVLLLFVAVSWAASKRLYSPIHHLLGLVRSEKDLNTSAIPEDEIKWIESQWNRLTRESQILQTKLDEKAVSFREGYLYRLLYGHFDYLSEQEIHEQMSALDGFPGNNRYLFVLVQISGLSGLEGRFSANDEQLITFAAANIYAELTSNSDEFEIEVINLYNLQVGLFIRMSEAHERKDWKKVIEPFCEQIIQTTVSLLRSNVTVVYSGVSKNIKELPELYQETLRAMNYREVFAVNQVLDARNMLLPDQDIILFPFDTEREIMKNLRTGDEEEAVKLVRLFFKQIQEKSGMHAMVLQAAQQLLGNIQYLMLQLGMDPNKIFDGMNLYAELSTLREPNEMVQWFEHKIIAPYVRSFYNSHDIKAKELIGAVVETMEMWYMKDLSLEAYAEFHQVNPFVLSKAFKRVMGSNFIDYLTHLRLKNAKEMLQNDVYRISEIAERVGYQVTYFNRVFKKYEHMTPGQYREKYKSGG